MTCGIWSGVSSIFSTISLVSWICAQLPQIYTNYCTKSAEGISPLFLLLWFLGDFLSFSSCVLNIDVVLKFQLYLSIFFLFNDVTLCFQYYYYNSVYPRYNYHEVSTSRQDLVGRLGFSNEANFHLSSNSIHIRHGPELDETQSLSNSDESPSSSFGSMDARTQGMAKSALVSAALHGSANAMALKDVAEGGSASAFELLGTFLAWACTFVYISSRCPQLYKNWQRKSVDGISPLLFGAALVGNLTYTISILFSCLFVYGEKTSFIVNELPYILGSSGTVVFDIAYFYQRHLYKESGRNNNLVGMEPWQE